MIRVDTVSGLSGQLVAFKTVHIGQPGQYAKAVVLRDNPTFPDLPYSVHTLYEPDPVNRPGELAAESGCYELSLEEALSKIGVTA